MKLKDKLTSYGMKLANEAIIVDGVEPSVAIARAFYAQTHPMTGREAVEYCREGALSASPHKKPRW